ncbi:hypothetical protein HOY80DRAFT_1073738 [Tuber brumale]|nr:hypothetical protein HOY80DRAFT_1073738 [Tuber brumale]
MAGNRIPHLCSVHKKTTPTEIHSTMAEYWFSAAFRSPRCLHYTYFLAKMCSIGSTKARRWFFAPFCSPRWLPYTLLLTKMPSLHRLSPQDGFYWLHEGKTLVLYTLLLAKMPSLHLLSRQDCFYWLHESKTLVLYTLLQSKMASIGSTKARHWLFTPVRSLGWFLLAPRVGEKDGLATPLRSVKLVPTSQTQVNSSHLTIRCF